MGELRPVERTADNASAQPDDRSLGRAGGRSVHFAHGAPRCSDVSSVVALLSEALADADIVHLDLKPGNIMLTTADAVRGCLETPVR